MAECGADALAGLRPHYTAMVSIADTADANPHTRAFLRHVAELQQRSVMAEREAQRWHQRCIAAEIQLPPMRNDLSALQEQTVQEIRGGDFEGRVQRGPWGLLRRTRGEGCPEQRYGGVHKESQTINLAPCKQGASREQIGGGTR